MTLGSMQQPIFNAFTAYINALTTCIIFLRGRKLKGKNPVFRLTVEKRQQHNNPSVLVHSKQDACSVLLLGPLVSSGISLNLKWEVSVG